MSRGHRELPHTADVYLEVYAPNLDQAFEEAGVALFEVMTDTSKVSAKLTHRFRIDAEDLHSLLFDYVRELLYLVDAEEYLFSEFKVRIRKIKGTYTLSAIVKGEKIDRGRHLTKTEIKAPTYAQMEIIESEKEVILRFVVDI